MPRRLAIITITFLLLAVPRWAHGAPGLPYYLALGDSLSRGVQPLPNGTLFPTNQGYVDDLYAIYRVKHPFLQLKKLGCPGETTTSMINGGECHYATDPTVDNQLAQALAFIQAHRVVLITITIGGDDVLHCISKTGAYQPSCVQDGLTAVLTNFQFIVSQLRAAAGPTVRIVAGNYYDPLLAASVLLPPPGGPILAEDSLDFTITLNTILQNAGVPVADVARAFRITDSSNVAGFNIPLNVLLELAWTWIGAPPPRGPDIHPNAAGYAVIAGAFVRKIGAL